MLTALSFQPTCRANHAPLAVVQLAWLCDLALTPDGRVDASQVAQGGRVGQAVQHLRHARPHLACAYHAPVAGRQRIPALACNARPSLREGLVLLSSRMRSPLRTSDRA